MVVDTLKSGNGFNFAVNGKFGVSADMAEKNIREIERIAFLDAFQKATLVYRMFKDRYSHSPVFLNRSLSYMKARKKRQRKHSLPIDKILHFKHQLDFPIKKFFISLFGVGVPHDRSTEKKAMVDVCIVRCNMPSRNPNHTVVKTFEATVEVNVFSNGQNIPTQGIHTSIFIPGDCFRMSEPHLFRSVGLMFRITLKDEASSLTCNETTSVYSGVFSCTKQDIYEGFNDTEIEIPLKIQRMDGFRRGEFAMLNQNQNLDLNDISVARLSFSLRSIPNQKVNVPNPLIEDTLFSLRQPFKSVEGAPPPDENATMVCYQFMYNNRLHQDTVSYSLCCPWCFLNCPELYGLIKHLQCCHARFDFRCVSASSSDKLIKIEVSLNSCFDGSYSGSPHDIIVQPPGECFGVKGPKKRSPVSSIIVCRPKHILAEDLEDLLDPEGKQKNRHRVFTTGHNRLYHHTSTCLPIHPREMDIDSEDERDPGWLQERTSMMIDEFTDVNEGEKELMKLWNIHMMRKNFVGDCQIVRACKEFVKSYSTDIVTKNLYRNFVLHLTNLFEFGLLSPEDLHGVVTHFHSEMKHHNSCHQLKWNWEVLTSYSINVEINFSDQKKYRWRCPKTSDVK